MSRPGCNAKQAGGQAGCGSLLPLVSAAALLKGQELQQPELLPSFCLQFAAWWCSAVGWVQLGCSGCHARGRIQDGFKLPTSLACSLTHHLSLSLLVHFPQPPSGRCGYHRGRAPLHARPPVAVRCRLIRRDKAQPACSRCRHCLPPPRGTRFIHSLLGPRSGSFVVRLSAHSMLAQSDDNNKRGDEGFLGRSQDWKSRPLPVIR